jgi:HK97 family phage major capsid protein
MDNNTLPYVQEGGAYNALETAEGTTKPDLGLTLVDATATAQTIAAYQKVRKQVLEDTAALQSILDERLRYAVRRRLEGQVIAGNGTDPNIRGILNTSGIGTVTFTAGDVLADKILAGITQIYLADGEADAPLSTR